MIKIQKIALTKLLKLELPQFVKQVTNCIEKYNPKALKLQDAFQFLVEQHPKMSLLIAPYGPHPLTERLDLLHRKRLKYAAAITLQMNLYRRIDIEETRELVRIAHPLVRIHLHYLRQNNLPVIDQTISSFFNQLRDNPDMQHALEALGLKYYLDELRKADSEHLELSVKRLHEISQRPKVNIIAIQREAQYVLRSLFEQINFYQFTYRDVDYSPLIAELNTLIARFTGLIHTRATCNKTSKKKAEAKLVEAEVAAKEHDQKMLVSENNSREPSKESELKKERIQPTITNKKETSEEGPLQSLMRILKFPDKSETS